MAQRSRLGLFQDTELAGKLENLMYLRKSKICSPDLDVQEANCCLTHFYRVCNHFSRCQIAYRMDGFHALNFWDKVIEVLCATNSVSPKHTSIQETGADLHSKTKAQKVKTAEG